MYPIIADFGFMKIYSYGFFLALAFLAATVVVLMETKRKGYERETAYDVVLLAIIGGVFGARIFYVIGHLKYFLIVPLDIFKIYQGGLVFYGGFLGGAIAILLYLKQKKLSIGDFADIVAPAVAIGAAVGRLGCFFNGCCYGKPATIPWAIHFFDTNRHPTQIYEFLMNLSIFGILWFLRKRITEKGFLFLIYLIIYSIARFCIEFLRVTIPVVFGLSGSQIISIFMFIFIVLFFLVRQVRRPAATRGQNRVS
ncbi:MAG: prolipoprotein diacylglyceryl transferase [Actinobacteria bacterium]|nr:prolipoprotein diacylglyceryl transferase [Actinomycetota bacterium]